MEPDLAGALDAVVASRCFTEGELPKPSVAEQKSPTTQEEPGDLLLMMGEDQGVDSDEDG